MLAGNMLIVYQVKFVKVLIDLGKGGFNGMV